MDRRNLIKGFAAFAAVAATVGLPKIADASEKHEEVLNFIRTEMKEAMNLVLFEPNDEKTRDWLKSAFGAYLSYLKDGGMIEAYQVVCDERNNPPIVLEAHRIAMDVYVKTKHDVNYINLYVLGPWTTATPRNYV